MLFVSQAAAAAESVAPELEHKGNDGPARFLFHDCIFFCSNPEDQNGESTVHALPLHFR